MNDIVKKVSGLLNFSKEKNKNGEILYFITAVQDNPYMRSISVNSSPKRLFRTTFSTF